MKSQSFAELDLVLEQAQSFLGHSVTEIILSKDTLIIGFYISGHNRWFIIDTHPKRLLFLVGEDVPRFKKEVKPLSLFLKARLKGLILNSIQRHKEYGRVIDLIFEGLEMSVQLTPMVRNVIVKQQQMIDAIQSKESGLPTPSTQHKNNEESTNR